MFDVIFIEAVDGGDRGDDGFSVLLVVVVVVDGVDGRGSGWLNVLLVFGSDAKDRKYQVIGHEHGRNNHRRGDYTISDKCGERVEELLR